MKKGGKRPGAGRKKGSLAPANLEKLKTLEAMQRRIYKVTDRVFDAQLSSALGQQFLYKIHTNSKGVKERPELVESEFEIRAYLNGDYDIGGEKHDKNSDFYFITTKAPDTRAIDSMYDRGFGKVSQPIGGGDDGTGPIQVQVIDFAKSKKNANNNPSS